MASITIPKNITRGEELMIVSRKDYQRFLDWQKTIIQGRKLSKTEKKALEEARKEMKRGYYSVV